MVFPASAVCPAALSKDIVGIGLDPTMDYRLYSIYPCFLELGSTQINLRVWRLTIRLFAHHQSGGDTQGVTSFSNQPENQGRNDQCRNHDQDCIQYRYLSLLSWFHTIVHLWADFQFLGRMVTSPITVVILTEASPVPISPVFSPFS